MAKLHDYASEAELRLAMVERMMAEMSSRLADLTRVVAELKGAPDRPAVPPQPFTIGADAVGPFAIGFHPREQDATSRPFRWTGDGPIFEFRFHIDRNVDWAFDMAVRVPEPIKLAGLKGFVDYAEVPLEIAASGQVRGFMPAQLFANRAVLSFFLRDHFVPNKINPLQNDKRSLALMFYSLALTPAHSAAAGARALGALNGKDHQGPASASHAIPHDAASDRAPDPPALTDTTEDLALD